ncbi:MAG: PD-(D/E)XK nuclease family protein [Lachnospiraceae bacterium]|nr:PD-(D/E)XK nuclease family protein [Lachnospiraceae bacterium]
MSLKFLLGEAGSGKSSQLTEEIIREALTHPEQSFLLLVPEQFCLSTQRILVERHPRHALINIEALSFDRLAGRAFREFGISPDSVISEPVKQMILALAVRDAMPQLSVYGRQALHPSFGAHLSTLFAEWEMNGIDPADLLKSAKERELPSLLQRKLQDLSTLFSAYRTRLGTRLTAEEKLPLFVRLLPKSGIGRVDHLYLDGFTGFTGVQYRILEQLMARAGETTAVLTLPENEDPDAWFDAKERRRDGLYAMSQETIWRLKQIARKLGLKHETEQYSHFAPARPKELTFLSRRLMVPGAARWEAIPQTIRLFSPESPEEEAEWAALRIRALVRQRSLRYRDIALLVSDQALYVPRLEKYLKEAEIPFFTDRRVSLKAHPLIRLLEDAWETVSGGRERDAFLRYVKNPCSPLSREESDRLENYLLAAGIRGGKKLESVYTKRTKRRRGETEAAWRERCETELKDVNELRERAFAPLQPIKDTIGRGRFAVSSAAATLKSLVGDPERKQKAEDLTEIWRLAGEEEKSAGWQEATEALLLFLDSLIRLFAGEKVSRAELSDMLKAGLSSLTVGKLPRSSDQIVIGDTERSRFGAVKHLIFLGMNADLLPKSGGGGGLLTDEERLLLSTDEMPAYTDERSLLEERFYLHNLLSLPRESLDLSFARMDSGRRSKQPAALIREVKALFPALKEEQTLRPTVSALGTERAALRRLAGGFGSGAAIWPLLYAVLKESPDKTVREGLTKIEAGAGYHFEPAGLPAETARALYGRLISGSVTRLENFAVCPYRHFLRYGLDVNEREEFSWESVDHGNFFHQVMETLLRHLTEENVPLSALTPERRQEEIRRALGAAEEKYPDFSENINAGYLLSRWEAYFDRYLEAMSRTESGTGFRPAAFELHFGAENGTALTLPLENDGVLRLMGTIDRLDVLEENDRLYLRVVDYKTGSRKIDFGAMDQGTQLQLGAYLTAALSIYEKKNPDKKILPGGLYYALLKENWLPDWAEQGKREEAVRKSFCLQGITAQEVASVSADAVSGKLSLGSEGLALLGRSICRKLQELGSRILQGEIAPSPIRQDEEHVSCGYCPYAPLCDRKDESFRYRESGRTDAADYLKKAKEAEEDGLFTQSAENH